MTTQARGYEGGSVLVAAVPCASTGETCRRLPSAGGRFMPSWQTMVVETCGTFMEMTVLEFRYKCPVRFCATESTLVQRCSSGFGLSADTISESTKN
jgi:hypothetical protein